MRLLVGVPFLFLFLGLPAAAPPAPPENPADAVVKLTNLERARRGRPPLVSNPRVMRAAQLHADQMARLGTLAHELRGARYPRAEDRLRAAGYRWQGWAENIASGQSTPADVLKSWMKSKGHRRNILEPSMTEIGVGVATDRAGRTYWVQLFARPLPAAGAGVRYPPGMAPRESGEPVAEGARGEWVELRSGWIDEARWMKSVLEAAGIDAQIPDEYTPVLPLAPGLEAGAVRLLVRSSDVERALDVLDASSPYTPAE